MMLFIMYSYTVDDLLMHDRSITGQWMRWYSRDTQFIKEML